MTYAGALKKSSLKIASFPETLFLQGLTLSLFMTRILTNDANHAFAANHFALHANFFNRCSYFHDYLLHAYGRDP